jgi:hypothetical protein
VLGGPVGRCRGRLHAGRAVLARFVRAHVRNMR